MQFKTSKYTVFENDHNVVTYITRYGDTSHVCSVRCYTRQASAKVTADYMERPDTDASRVTFQQGESEARCEVELMSDSLHEGEEMFHLVLGDPQSPTAGAARIGSPDHALIEIIDLGDKSVIKFAEKRFTIREPELSGETRIVSIPVIRVGDTSKVAIVRVYTRDGTARAGRDYIGFSNELTFGVGVTRLDVRVKILHDVQSEMREAFSVHLRPDRNLVAQLETNKATVYIERTDSLADVIFPSRPVVVSLQDYNDVDRASPQPTSGYPVICVTACDPHHPDFSQTKQLCLEQGINHTLTRYRWRVSHPSGMDGFGTDMKDVQPAAFFASTHLITLDSIYFKTGSRIECVARAIYSEGDPGLELSSTAVTISSKEGVCLPRVEGSLGAEPFSAKMKYTGPSDVDHPNMVRLSVLIPHRDGMVPAISTHVLSNFGLALSPDAFRVGLHKCSNLIDPREKETGHTFLGSVKKDLSAEALPLQFSRHLRSEPTLTFYRNLDLESCIWEFVSYYTLSELVDQCGGEIGIDGQVLNLTQSYVSIRVPLYVSYVFHSPDTRSGWVNYNLQTEMQLTFVYDTAILWPDGISSPEGSKLKGVLHPTSMTLTQDRRLRVQFHTETLFRGQFVPNHPVATFKSTVTSKSQSALTFTLELLTSESTFAQPKQTWQFTSDHAVRDYSGDYVVRLIPCTTPTRQPFTRPLTCNPHDPVPFDLRIRFQQVSDPVPTEFSLDTQFHLLRKKSLWLSDGSMGFGEGIDTSFTADDWIYGRIMTDPLQTRGETFNLGIEKLFLCTGRDGYIPKYNPASREYGCVSQSQNLLHTFRILDRGAPSTEVRSFHGINFKAILAVDDPEAKDLIAQPGSDGFRMSARPLFELDSGRQWFLHAIYNVRSPRASRNRRDVEHNLFMAAAPYKLRHKRALQDVADIGEASGTGTNLVRIVTKVKPPTLDDASVGHATGEVGQLDRNEIMSNVYQTSTLVVIAIVLLLLLLLPFIIICRRRRRQKKETGNYDNATSVAVVNGNVEVMNTKYIGKDSSEV